MIDSPIFPFSQTGLSSSGEGVDFAPSPGATPLGTGQKPAHRQDKDQDAGSVFSQAITALMKISKAETMSLGLDVSQAFSSVFDRRHFEENSRLPDEGGNLPPGMSSRPFDNDDESDHLVSKDQDLDINTKDINTKDINTKDINARDINAPDRDTDGLGPGNRSESVYQPRPMSDPPRSPGSQGMNTGGGTPADQAGQFVDGNRWGEAISTSKQGSSSTERRTYGMKGQDFDLRVQVIQPNQSPPRPSHLLASALPIQETLRLEAARTGNANKAVSGEGQAFLNPSRLSDPGILPKVTGNFQPDSPPVSGKDSASGEKEGRSSSSSSPPGLILKKVASSGLPQAGGIVSRLFGDRGRIVASTDSLHTGKVLSSLPSGAAGQPMSGWFPERAAPLNKVLPGHSRLPHPQTLPVREQIAVNIHKAALKGVERISIQLKPAELGRVEVHLDLRVDQRAVITFLADRPETLDILQRDARGLEQALREAGVKTDTGHLNFSLRQGHNGGQSAEDNGQNGSGDTPEDSASDTARQDKLTTNPSLMIGDGQFEEGSKRPLNLVV